MKQIMLATCVAIIWPGLCKGDEVEKLVRKLGGLATICKTEDGDLLLEVILPEQVTDGDLAKIAGPRIGRLYLNGGNITDTGAKSLRACVNLETLVVRNVP